MTARSSPTFEFDLNSDVPVWVQLRKRLIYLINSGYYKPGDQLPTVRGLASQISINYNTVNKAYLSMTYDGYITSTRGRGVFVSEHFDDDACESLQEAGAMLADYVAQCRELGLTTDDIQGLLRGCLRELDNKEDGDRS